MMEFAAPADDRVKLKESEKKNIYLDLAGEIKKKTMEHESDGDTHCNWCARYSHQRIDNGIGGLWNKRASVDHPIDSIVEIGQNTKKNPGDLLSLRLQWKTLMWRTLKSVKQL